MKAQIICIEGYWKDDRKSFEHRCLVMPKDATDSMRDSILKELRLNDDEFFYIFEEGESIVGEHLDFVVVFYNPIESYELGEMQ